MPEGTFRRAKFGSFLAVVATFATILPPSAAATVHPIQQLAIVNQAQDGHHVIFLWDTMEGLQGDLVDLSGRDAIQPAWSPDGQTLVFAAQTEPGGPFALFTVRPGGTNQSPATNQDLEQLTFPAGPDEPSEGDFSPSWSPDGQWLAFARTIDGISKIYYRHIDAAVDERLTVDPWSYEVEPSWMQDSTTVVFANRAFEPEPGDDPNHPAFRFQIVEAPVLDPGFARSLTAERGIDLRTPDVSPDGTAIAVAATFVELGGDTTSATIPLAPLNFPEYGTFEGAENPDWSPDGRSIAADFGSHVVISGDFADAIEGSDAAWRPLERVAPDILITPDVDGEGWLTTPEVTVTAEDANSGIGLVECELDGRLIVRERPGDGFFPTTLQTTAFVDGPEGIRTLTCSAFDGSGNVASTSMDLLVDFEAPRLGTPVFPNPIPVGEPVEVSAPFAEEGSGVRTAELTLRSDSILLTTRMDAVGNELFGSVHTSAGIYEVIVTVTDQRGQTASIGAPDYVIVFDPSAGSASGSGSIVPGGATSDPGDSLPEIDGQTKSSFSLTAKYRTDSAATPTGFLVFSYGSRFKLKSTGLDWLVREGPYAILQGTAEIAGQPGTFVFQIEVVDTDVDRFELRVWPSSAHPSSDPPLFQATGDSEGQIRIRD